MRATAGMAVGSAPPNWNGAGTHSVTRPPREAPTIMAEAPLQLRPGMQCRSLANQLRAIGSCVRRLLVAYSETYLSLNCNAIQGRQVGHKGGAE